MNFSPTESDFIGKGEGGEALFPSLFSPWREDKKSFLFSVRTSPLPMLLLCGNGSCIVAQKGWGGGDDTFFGTFRALQRPRPCPVAVGLVKGCGKSKTFGWGKTAKLSLTRCVGVGGALSTVFNYPQI